MNFNPVFLNLIQKMTHPEKGIHTSGESPKFLFADLIQVAPVQNIQNSEFVPGMLKESQDEMSNEPAVSSHIPLNIILPTEFYDTLVSEISSESTPLQKEQISLELSPDKLTGILNKATSFPIIDTESIDEELNLNTPSLKNNFESEKIIEALQSGKPVILSDKQNAELKIVMESLINPDKKITSTNIPDIIPTDDGSVIEYKGFVFNRESLELARDNNRPAMPAIKTPVLEVVNKTLLSDNSGENKSHTETNSIGNSNRFSEPLIKDSGSLQNNKNSSISSKLVDLLQNYGNKPDIIKISIHNTQQVNNSPEIPAALSSMMLKKAKLVQEDHNSEKSVNAKNHGPIKNESTQLSFNEEVSIENVLQSKPVISANEKKSAEHIHQTVTLQDSESTTGTDFINKPTLEESNINVNSPDKIQTEEKLAQYPDHQKYNHAASNDIVNSPVSAIKTETSGVLQNHFNTNSGNEVYRTIIHIQEAAPEIVRIVASGEYKSLELKLVPRELGKVRVLIDSSDNNISLKIEVETEAAKEIIQNSLSNLAGKFSADNLILQNVSINLMPKEKGPEVPFNGKRKAQKQEKPGETEPEKINVPKNLGYNTYDYLV